jgi:ABC-type transporter Mla subunit MlaD
MNTTIKVAIAAGAITLAALTVWGCFGLNHAAIIALDKWGNAAPDLKPTLDAISGPRGTLHEVNKAAVKIGDAIVQTQLVERAMTPHITAAMDQFGAAAVHLSGAADSLKGTADTAAGTFAAATGAIQTLTIDAQTANDLLVQLKPLIASYTATGNDLDITIKTANGIMASQNVTIMLANGAQFTTTAVQLEQKLAQCTLHPTLPCVLKSDILFGAQVGGYLLR